MQAHYAVHVLKDLRPLKVEELVSGSYECYEAGGEEDPCTYLYHELPSDATAEQKTKLEHRVLQELAIGRMLQESPAAGLGIPTIAFYVDSTTEGNPQNLFGYLVRYPPCVCTLGYWFDRRDPHHCDKLEAFIHLLMSSTDYINLNPRHCDWHRVLVTTVGELILIDFSYARPMDSYSGCPADFYICQPVGDAGPRAPEQVVSSNSNVTHESMQTFVFLAAFNHAFLLSGGGVCMNLLESSWHQAVDADIDLSAWIEDFYVADRLMMCLRWNPSRRLQVESYFGHMSMWRNDPERLRMTLENLAVIIRNVPEFKNYAQNLLGPLLDNGQFLEVMDEAVILAMRLKNPSQGDMDPENRTDLFDSIFINIEDPVLGFRYIVGHFNQKFRLLLVRVLKPLVSASVRTASYRDRKQLAFEAFHKYLVENKPRAMYLLGLNRAAVDCGIPHVRNAFWFPPNHRGGQQQPLTAGRPQAVTISMQALQLLMDSRFTSAKAQGVVAARATMAAEGGCGSAATGRDLSSSKEPQQAPVNGTCSSATAQLPRTRSASPAFANSGGSANVSSSSEMSRAAAATAGTEAAAASVSRSPVMQQHQEPSTADASDSAARQNTATTAARTPAAAEAAAAASAAPAPAAAAAAAVVAAAEGHQRGNYCAKPHPEGAEVHACGRIPSTAAASCVAQAAGCARPGKPAAPTVSSKTTGTPAGSKVAIQRPPDLQSSAVTRETAREPVVAAGNVAAKGTRRSEDSQQARQDASIVAAAAKSTLVAQPSSRGVVKAADASTRKSGAMPSAKSRSAAAATALITGLLAGGAAGPGKATSSTVAAAKPAASLAGNRESAGSANGFRGSPSTQHALERSTLAAPSSAPAAASKQVATTMVAGQRSAATKAALRSSSSSSSAALKADCRTIANGSVTAAAAVTDRAVVTASAADIRSGGGQHHGSRLVAKPLGNSAAAQQDTTRSAARADSGGSASTNSSGAIMKAAAAAARTQAATGQLVDKAAAGTKGAPVPGHRAAAIQASKSSIAVTAVASDALVVAGRSRSATNAARCPAAVAAEEQQGKHCARGSGAVHASEQSSSTASGQHAAEAARFAGSSKPAALAAGIKATGVSAGSKADIPRAPACQSSALTRTAPSEPAAVVAAENMAAKGTGRSADSQQDGQDASIVAAAAAAAAKSTLVAPSTLKGAAKAADASNLKPSLMPNTKSRSAAAASALITGPLAGDAAGLGKATSSTVAAAKPAASLAGNRESAGGAGRLSSTKAARQAHLDVTGVEAPTAYVAKEDSTAAKREPTLLAAMRSGTLRSCSAACQSAVAAEPARPVASSAAGNGRGTASKTSDGTGRQALAARTLNVMPAAATSRVATKVPGGKLSVLQPSCQASAATNATSASGRPNAASVAKRGTGGSASAAGDPSACGNGVVAVKKTGSSTGSKHAYKAAECAGATKAMAAGKAAASSSKPPLAPAPASAQDAGAKGTTTAAAATGRRGAATKAMAGGKAAASSSKPPLAPAPASAPDAAAPGRRGGPRISFTTWSQTSKASEAEAGGADSTTDAAAPASEAAPDAAAPGRRGGPQISFTTWSETSKASEAEPAGADSTSDAAAPASEAAGTDEASDCAAVRLVKKRTRAAALEQPTNSAAAAVASTSTAAHAELAVAGASAAAGPFIQQPSKAERERAERARDMSKYADLLRQLTHLSQARGSSRTVDQPSPIGRGVAAFRRYATRRPDVLLQRSTMLSADLQCDLNREMWQCLLSEIILLNISDWHCLVWCAEHSIVHLAADINNVQHRGKAFLTAWQINTSMYGVQHVATCIAKGLDPSTIPNTIPPEMQKFFWTSLLVYYISMEMYEAALALEVQEHAADIQPLKSLASALKEHDFLTTISVVLQSNSPVLAVYLNTVEVDKWQLGAAHQLHDSPLASDHQHMDARIVARRLGFAAKDSLQDIQPLPEQVRCRRQVERRAIGAWTSESDAIAAAISFAKHDCSSFAKVVRVESKEFPMVMFLKSPQLQQASE